MAFTQLPSGGCCAFDAVGLVGSLFPTSVLLCIAFMVARDESVVDVIKIDESTERSFKTFLGAAAPHNSVEQRGGKSSDAAATTMWWARHELSYALHPSVAGIFAAFSLRFGTFALLSVPASLPSQKWI